MKSKLIIHENGTQEWRSANGNPHRLDGPAIIHIDGYQAWFINGLRHRTDGPAIQADSYQEWYLNGLLHRIGGPAIIWSSGDQEWYVNGVRHREDGPATIFPQRDGYLGNQFWYLNGKNVTNTVKKWMKNQNKKWPWDDETQTQFMLTFL